jgi:hypothetical protein
LGYNTHGSWDRRRGAKNDNFEYKIAYFGIIRVNEQKPEIFSDSKEMKILAIFQ